MEASPSLPERKLGGSGIRNNSAGATPSQHGAPAQRRPYTTEVVASYLQKAQIVLGKPRIGATVWMPSLLRLCITTNYAVQCRPPGLSKLPTKAHGKSSSKFPIFNPFSTVLHAVARRQQFETWPWKKSRLQSIFRVNITLVAVTKVSYTTKRPLTKVLFHFFAVFNFWIQKHANIDRITARAQELAASGREIWTGSWITC